MEVIMQKLLLATLAAAALCLSSFTSAFASDVQVGDLKIMKPWTRATPPNAKVGGGYLTIMNSGTAADRLVSATSAVAGKVEIHDMKIEDGVMKMRPLTGGLDIPAGETVTLAPGGLHVMFMKLAEPFKMGEMVKATLVFEKAGSVEVMFPIAAIGASDGGHMKHGASN